MSKIDRKIKLEKGIKINLGFRQFVVVSFVIIVMFVLPVYFLENGSNAFSFLKKSDNSNPYSAQALQQRESTGDVAGISTQRTEDTSLSIFNNEINFSFQNEKSLPLLISGVVFVTISFFLVLYLALGKFDTN